MAVSTTTNHLIFSLVQRYDIYHNLDYIISFFQTNARFTNTFVFEINNT
jgi:hypothetical protein